MTEPKSLDFANAAAALRAAVDRLTETLNQYPPGTIPTTDLLHMADGLLRHYMMDQEGQPVPATFMEWAIWFETADRQVAESQLHNIRVSTVFIGCCGTLFESRVFGGPHDGEARRYRTRLAAMAGHADLCSIAWSEV